MSIADTLKERPLIKRIIKRNWDRVVDLGLTQLLPSQVHNYAKGISKATELDENTVLKSEGVKKYRDKFW